MREPKKQLKKKSHFTDRELKVMIDQPDRRARVYSGFSNKMNELVFRRSALHCQFSHNIPHQPIHSSYTALEPVTLSTVFTNVHGARMNS